MAPLTVQRVPVRVRRVLASPLAQVRAARAGVPLGVVDEVLEHLVSLAEFERLIVPRRTLAHRRLKRQRLSPEESDRFLRVMRVIAHAYDVFGAPDKANTWLRRPNRALKGAVPLLLLDTDGGAEAVDTILDRITHGVYS